MDMSESYGFEVDTEDATYVELERQILLLTAEEEDGVGEKESNRQCRNAVMGLSTLPSYSASFKVSAASQGGRGYYCGFDLFGSEETAAEAVPLWLSNMWRRGDGIAQGTGVFIPFAARTKRKQKRGRTDIRGQTQRGRRGIA